MTLAFSFSERLAEMKFDDIWYFKPFITILILCFLLIVSNIIRRFFLKRMLFPTAVIAGLLGLAVREGVKALFNYDIFDQGIMDLLTYHLLAIGFIALTLRDKDVADAENPQAKSGTEKVAAYRSGAFIVSGYIIQGIVGLLISILLMTGIAKCIGLMLPMGFGQGPGQASNVGRIWDDLKVFVDYGEGAGLNFGMAVAAFGFLWASIIGVVFLNYCAKKRGIKLDPTIKMTSGMVLNQTVEAPDEIPLSESIDKFTIQIAMILAIYAVAYFILFVIDFFLGGVLGNLMKTLWGFNFIIAVFVTMLTKMILKKLRKNGRFRRYPNNYMLNRVSGFSFDFMIVTAIAGISLSAIGALWMPLLVITTVGGIVTTIFLWFMCKWLYGKYHFEAFLGYFGMQTGTISNGMILLGEIDKGFHTPIANDLVIGSSTAIIFGAPILVLITYSVTQPIITFGILIVYMAFLLGVIFLAPKIFKKKSANAAATQQDTVDSDAPDFESLEANAENNSKE